LKNFLLVLVALSVMPVGAANKGRSELQKYIKDHPSLIPVSFLPILHGQGDANSEKMRAVSFVRKDKDGRLNHIIKLSGHLNLPGPGQHEVTWVVPYRVVKPTVYEKRSMPDSIKWYNAERAAQQLGPRILHQPMFVISAQRFAPLRLHGNTATFLSGDKDCNLAVRLHVRKEEQHKVRWH
jgi:hypothetical protein